MKTAGSTTLGVLFLLNLWQCTPERVSLKEAVVAAPSYVEIADQNTDYFQLSDGSPYVPLGINLIGPSGRYRNNPDSAFWEIEQWMKELSGNGGNYVRIWLSNSFWDIEEEKAGAYQENKALRIDRFMGLARKYGLRIKMTLEHFRGLTLEENPKSWAVKFPYHTSQGGPLDSIRQYITSNAGHDLFLNKLNFYQQRYRSDTLFFGWELWNEMNAMRGPEDSAFFGWNQMMLTETKRRFPRNLVMQSFGSFDREAVRDSYRRMIQLADNEVAQVHRYLDLGAQMEICQAPMDVICSSAIQEILGYNPGKPVLLAETGAVEPRHTGPSRFYSLDTAGIILHDVLFAPFFSGSAGAGMNWHWGHYVHKNQLWYHFGRFRNAVRNINPITERFRPSQSETDQFRIYILHGRSTTLIWVRDKKNDWKSELDQGVFPETIQGSVLNTQDLGITSSASEVQFYDPWNDNWSDGQLQATSVELPGFKRSLVLRVETPR